MCINRDLEESISPPLFLLPKPKSCLSSYGEGNISCNIYLYGVFFVCLLCCHTCRDIDFYVVIICGRL